MVEITLTDLPKVSNNKFYAGMHWAKRKALKDTFKLIIRSQTKLVIDYPCEVIYSFGWKGRLLDISNCVGGLKMIEDVLFPDDSPKIVKKITIISEKTKTDRVLIKVKNVNKC